MLRKVRQAEQNVQAKQKELQEIIDQHEQRAPEADKAIREGSHPETQRLISVLQQCETEHQDMIRLLVKKEIRLRELEM